MLFRSHLSLPHSLSLPVSQYSLPSLSALALSLARSFMPFSLSHFILELNVLSSVILSFFLSLYLFCPLLFSAKGLRTNTPPSLLAIAALGGQLETSSTRTERRSYSKHTKLLESERERER